MDSVVEPPPVQREAGVAVAVGLGFAVMITLVEAPVQELEVGVTE